MDRLTHERKSGIKTGYWSPAKKEELVQHLAAYERTGLTPDQVQEVTELKKRLEWIPVTERLPETESGWAYVLVSLDDGFVATTDYTADDGFELWADSGEIVAWMPLPEPYRPESVRGMGRI